MSYGKPKAQSPYKGLDHHEARRHTGSSAAKKLGSMTNVVKHTATHVKSRMKRYT